MLHLIARGALPKQKLPAAQVPADAIAPAFAELSPDLRYKLLRRRAARAWLLNGAVYLAAAALLAPVAVPQLNTAADSAIAQLLNLKQQADTAAEFISPDFAAPVQKGEAIAGYPVTSGYGLRDTSNLPTGASADHRGVDLATPEGTKVYAPGRAGDRVTVRCWTDSAGGGLVAEIESASFPNLWFQALHLSDCKTGIYHAGDDIASTGASGIGAAHLDWRQRDRITDKHQHPQKSYLLWALTGREPSANFTRIDILRNAIIGQESGGHSAAVNPDSGAMGLGQVMPENLGGTGDGWDYDALGKDLTPDEFLADTDAQNKIINHQLSQTFDAQIAAGRSEDEAIRRTAATWYSGNPDNADDATPQTYGASSYPSIKDYSDQVLEKTRTLQQRRLGQLDK